MKKWHVLLGLVMTLLMTPVAYGTIVDRIVAVVNEDIITLSELNEAFEPYREKIERTTAPGPERDRAMVEAKNTSSPGSSTINSSNSKPRSKVSSSGMTRSQTLSPGYWRVKRWN